MAIENAFNQSASWSAKSAIDKFGKFSFAAPVTVPCRIQLKKVVLRKDGNEDIVADCVVYASKDTNFRPNDKFEYTDSAGVSRRFEILEVYEARARAVLNHKKLFLKYAKV